MFLYILILGFVAAKPFDVNNAFDSIQVCPGATLVINVIVEYQMSMDINKESQAIEKEVAECVQNNENLELICKEAKSCIQNNVDIKQDCLNGICRQINPNGGNSGFTPTTKSPFSNFKNIFCDTFPFC